MENSFDLSNVPPYPDKESFRFLLNPSDKQSATLAVETIYSYLFWEDYEGKNKDRIDQCLDAGGDLLTRWIKNRADKALTVFDDLVNMSSRTSAMFQIYYADSGLQFIPDENEEVYEKFEDFIKSKFNDSGSVGEKSELAWAIDELIPTMRDRGLDITPLIGQKEFYTKFRHWIQSIRQRDKLINISSRRFKEEKNRIERRITKEKPDTDEVLHLVSTLKEIAVEEKKHKDALLDSYESVIVNGLQDLVNPQISVRDLDDKWKLNFAPALGSLGKGIGYTALVDNRNTLFIAEFDYSMLNSIEKSVETMIDVAGMTDPLIIIRQLREIADKIEATIGGKK